MITGGHPRCIVFALNHLTKTGRVPEAIEIAKAATLPHVTSEDAIDALRLSFVQQTYGGVLASQCLKELFARGALSFIKAGNHGGWIALTLPILAQCVFDAERSPSASALWRDIGALLREADPRPTKKLEAVDIYCDIFRMHLRLLVVPPEMADDLFIPLRQSSVRHWSQIQFAFNEDFVIDTASVITVTTNPKTWHLKGFDPKTAYDDKRRMLYNTVHVPKVEGHAAFESMYTAVGFTARGRPIPIAVLKQDKINSDLSKALNGLNKAADLMVKSGWAGEFLFIVTGR